MQINTSKLEAYYRSINKTVSPSTVNMYINAYEQLTHKMKDPFDLTEFQQQNFKLTTAIIYLKSLNTIGKCLKLDITVHEKLLKELLIREKSEKKEVTLKATYSDLVRVSNYYLDKDKKKYLVATFYLYFPIRNDLIHLKHKNYDANLDNYVSIENDVVTLTLNCYKTAKIYGKKQYSVQDNIFAQKLSEYFTKYDYVFSNFGKPFANQTMIMLIRTMYKKVLGIELSIAQLRKIKIAHEYESAKTTSDFLKISSKYMHNLGTEFKYYLE